MLAAYLFLLFSKTDHKERRSMSMPSHYHDYCYFLNCISLPRVWAALPFANSKTPISSREAPSRSHTCWCLREARVALQWLILPSVPRTESLTQYLSSIHFFFFSRNLSDLPTKHQARNFKIISTVLRGSQGEGILTPGGTHYSPDGPSNRPANMKWASHSAKMSAANCP